MMDLYRSSLFEHQLLGIPLDAWQRFLKVFSSEDPAVRIDKLAEQLMKERGKSSETLVDPNEFRALMSRLMKLLQGT